jgi:predicted nucleic acid-binding protein
MILLDSNVLLEFMVDRPDKRVIGWLDRQPRISVWTTSLSVFEIRFGLQTMPMGKRKESGALVFERLLRQTIQGRIASFDNAAAEQAAELAARRRETGRLGELRDTMIAGIVLASRATLATRNVKHFEDIASSVVNPWEA